MEVYRGSARHDVRDVRKPCQRCGAPRAAGQKRALVPRQNETVVLAEQALDEAALRDAIAATGYEVGGVTRQQAQKGLFGWR